MGTQPREPDSSDKPRPIEDVGLIGVGCEGVAPDDGSRIVRQLELWEFDAERVERARLREVPDVELQRQFDAAFPIASGEFERDPARDRILLEIVRRGGVEWQHRLRTKLAALETWRVQTAAEAASLRDPGQDPVSLVLRVIEAHDLELLIALRRLEGRPDPVRVEAPALATSTFPDMPRVHVRLVNHDERPVMITDGGNYRSGREARWRVEVTDAEGRLTPEASWPGDGGGTWDRCRLARAGSADVLFPLTRYVRTVRDLETTLPLNRYVAPAPPGAYRVRIQYHDVLPIADSDVFPEQVAVDGAAFALHVTPRVVATTPPQRRRLRQLAESLPRRGPVIVIEGPYGPWAHGVMPPDSAQGQLIGAGWEAVPALLRLAASEDADPTRRAWALALLHAISDAFQPLGCRHVGACRWYRQDQDNARASPSGGCDDAEIDSTSQTRLAVQWATIARGVEFRETP